jgi:transcriptional regulator with XRE-family HTH domain
MSTEQSTPDIEREQLRERPHGRAKYVVERCRCDVCREDANAYSRNRVRQRAYGRPAYVDAEPARRHIAMLGAAGIGWKRVAMLAGLDHSVLWKLVYGDQKRFGRPSKRIRPETERKILAVTATLDNVADGTPVDATGARRRLQALVAIGWSQSKLGARLGISPPNMTTTMRSGRMLVSTVRAIHRLYEELWNTSPPEESHRDKIAASRSRRYAREHGWVPPMAWDDDTIDDPAAVPEGGEVSGSRQKLPDADELRFLLEYDSKAAVANRFGVKVATIERALLRERAA